MRYLVLTALCLMLAGCGATQTFKYSVDAATPVAPASVKEKCPPIDKRLVKVPGKADSVTMGDLLQANDYLIGLYGECATRDAAKANWIASQKL